MNNEKITEKLIKELMKNIINSNPEFSKESKDSMNKIIEMVKKPEDA